LNYINNLIEQSIWILRETKAQFPEDKTIELCSWGKDSISTLFLVQEAFSYFPWKIVHIDTGCKFPEMYALRDRLQKELKFDLKIIKGKGEASPEKNRFECCTRMKTEALKKYIKDNEIEAVVVSIRRDEHGIRNKERIISPRYKGKWNIWKKEGGESGTSMQDVELYSWGILESDFGDADHVRVHPLINWDEIDVWRYIKKRNIPFNSLYLSNYIERFYYRKNMRYRSLGCSPCTDPIPSNASTIDEIIKELSSTNISERSGRTQDKETSSIMQRLRALGYM